MVLNASYLSGVGDLLHTWIDLSVIVKKFFLLQSQGSS